MSDDQLRQAETGREQEGPALSGPVSDPKESRSGLAASATPAPSLPPQPPQLPQLLQGQPLQAVPVLLTQPGQVPTLAGGRLGAIDVSASRKALRRAASASLAQRIRIAEQIADGEIEGVTPADRMRALDFLARLGPGYAAPQPHGLEDAEWQHEQGEDVGPVPGLLILPQRSS